jgi:HSP20 family protein
MRSINRIAWMWDEALQALQQAERRHRQFAGLNALASGQPVWEPPADVFETESEVFVFIALPGAALESVSVHVSATGLVIVAERVPPTLERVRVRRLEIPYGRFERHIELPGGQYVVLERAYRDGCLELRLRKE